MKPNIYCNNYNSVIARVFARSKLDKDSFKASNWYPGALLQSAAALFKYGPANKLENIQRDVIHLINGGQVGIDWVLSGKMLKTTPIIINFPGVGADQIDIAGGLTGLIAKTIGSNADFRFGNVVYQGISLTQKSPYICSSCYCGTDDISAILKHVRKQYPDAPLIVIGCSIGSAHFTRWAGANPEKCKNLNICGAIMIAHGTSSEQTQLTSLRYCCGIFSYKVLKQWKTITLENVNNRQYLKSLEESGEYPGFSLKNLENASNVRQWDEACLPLYKFDTLDEMFKKCDSTNYLNDIPIPICFINAADDPVCLWSRLENHEVFKNSNMGFICTSNGGHLGWVDSENGGWISRLILKLITGFITEYYIENDRRY